MENDWAPGSGGRTGPSPDPRWDDSHASWDSTRTTGCRRRHIASHVVPGAWPYSRHWLSLRPRLPWCQTNPNCSTPAVDFEPVWFATIRPPPVRSGPTRGQSDCELSCVRSPLSLLIVRYPIGLALGLI